MTRAFSSVSLGILFFSLPVFGQASGVKFEVASVKPAVYRSSSSGGVGERGAAGAGGGCPSSMKVDPGRVDFRCTTLQMLIGYAFRVSPDRVTGPDWMMAMGAPRFGIVAKIPQDASENQVPDMLQALLAERFKLVIHRGTANLPIYALVVAKGGLKVKEAAPEAAAEAASADPDAPPSLDGFYGNVQRRTIPNANGSDSTTMISSPRMGTVRQSGDHIGSSAGKLPVSRLRDWRSCWIMWLHCRRP